MPEKVDKSAAWTKLKSELKIGQIVEGKVLAHWPFGVFVDLAKPFVGLIEIVNFKEKGDRMTPGVYPELGEPIRCVVMQFADHNFQVGLSVRPSDLKTLVLNSAT
jgi:ribosomal protein S1